MLLQKVGDMVPGYLGTCCPINIPHVMGKNGPKPKVLVISLPCDSSVSSPYFFQKEVMDQWATEISVTLTLQRSIWLLQKEYSIKNIEEINKFLILHRQLSDILLIAPSQIYHIFGDVSLALQLLKDPEEDYECLFIIIKSNYSPAESFDLLDKLSEAWWVDVDMDIKRYLEIDISTNRQF